MKEKEIVTTIISVALILLTVIASVAWYNVNDRSLMSKNISEAVSKGMDPLSVRCSYAQPDDTICIAYAASTNRK